MKVQMEAERYCRVSAGDWALAVEHQCLKEREPGGRFRAGPEMQKFPLGETSADGARRIRTADLLGAIQALCQLSYSPECVGGRIVPAPSQGEG
jgi:hypothetical protein